MYILGGKFPREIKGKGRLINRGRGFNYCLQKWFGRRIVESFIDDGSPATGFFPRNRGLAESLDCCQLKGTLSFSLSSSLFLELEGLIGLIFLKNEASRSLLSPNENVVPSRRKVASYSSSSSSSFDSSLYTVINASDSFAPSFPRNGCNYRSISSFLHVRIHIVLYLFIILTMNLHIKVSSSSIIND